MFSKIKERLMSKEIKYFLTVVGFSFVSAYVIYFILPEFTPYFVEEDSVIENLSAFSYLLAFFLGIWVLTNYGSWWKLSLPVALLGLVGFLDEISFGERIFDLTMPVVLGVKVDAAHDFVAIFYLFLKDIFGLYGLVAIILGLGIIVAGLFLYQQKYSFRDLTGNLFQTLPGQFLVLFFFFLFAATIIDLKEDYIPFVIVEELFEMFAGFSLCLYSLSLIKTEEKQVITDAESEANMDSSNIHSPAN